MNSGNDSGRDLALVLSYLAKRRLKLSELLDALGVSRSTYYEQKDRGTLASMDNLIRAADAFNLSRTELLLRFGYLDTSDVIDCAETLAADPIRTIGRITARTALPPL